MRLPPLGTHPVPPGILGPLPGADAALIGVAGLVVVMFPILWPLAMHVNVIAHEGAHTLVGAALGFSVAGVVLDEDSGRTDFRDMNVGLRWLLTGFIGYLGPSAFGLVAAKLIETGRLLTVLWLAILLLVLLLFLVRKSAGIVSVPIAIALLAYVTHNAHAWVEQVTIYGITWLLLLSGVRVALEHGVNAGDAAILSGRTHIPRLIWSLLWIAGTLIAVVVGGKWMVLRT
jgi:hypothetical protein